MSEFQEIVTTEKSMLQLVVFSLSGCEMCIDIEQTREILRLSDMTRMPKAPDFVEGIISLRGRIIPVLDLKKRFQWPLIDRSTESRILVVEIQEQVAGLLVDKVTEVIKVPPEAEETFDDLILGVGSDLVRGVLRLRERMILVFRPEKDIYEGRIAPVTKSDIRKETYLAIRVLFTDDSSFMRSILKGIILRDPYVLAGEASNGKEALELYMKLKPDLVTMDIVMPEMDGIEAVRQIRNFDPEAKIIMVSAMGQQNMVIDSIQAGARDFIIKPFQPPRVLEALKRVVGA